MAGFIFADTATIDGAQLRTLLGAMMSKASPRPMGALTGVPTGTGTVVTATSTGLAWTVNPHVGYIDAETPAAAGAYGYGFDAPVNGNYNAADMTYDRLDLLSVQIDDPAEGDGTGSEMPAVVYTPGSPGASPSLPSTPARSMQLAQIRVPGGGGAPVVTMIAPFTVASGGVMPCTGPATYPANPYVGQYVDDMSSGKLMRWNGTLWLPIIPTSYCRLTRTTGIGGVDSAGGRPLGWSTIDNVGSAFTASTGTGPIVAAKNCSAYWSATVPFISGSTDFVVVQVEVNGVGFASGKQTGSLNGAHVTVVSAGGYLDLNIGDSVELVVFDLDHSITTGNPVSFGMHRVG